MILYFSATGNNKYVAEKISEVTGDYILPLKKLVREKNYKNVECLNCGIWNEKKILTLHYRNDGLLSIVDDGDLHSSIDNIKVDAIDNFVGDSKIDFIKMDIEGSELAALEGAKKTIQKFCPVLAICAYHKKEDLITLPQFIKSVSENYNFYIRKYGNTVLGELVLYAVPK